MSKQNVSEAELKVLVLGIGNALLKDEGVGVHVARHLQGMTLPQNVRVVECGTRLLAAAALIERAEKLIVIDAVRAGCQPGTVFRLEEDDLSCAERRPISLHEVGLLETLDIVGKTGRRPSATIIGVEPKEISVGLELSPEVERRVPEIIKAVLQEACGPPGV